MSSPRPNDRENRSSSKNEINELENSMFETSEIRPEERKAVLDLLIEYDKHITVNPFTLLPQWYGLYRVEAPGQEDMEFLACNNVFHCIDSIELLYDIKGCWDRSGHMERRIGHHYPNPVGCIYDRRSLDPAQPLPHEFVSLYLRGR